MDFSFSREQIEFRGQVRGWLKEALPPDLAAKAAVDASFDMADVMKWHKILHAKGWAAPHWPKQHGGPGWDPTQRFIFSEEMDLAGAPSLSPFGLVMVGPLIIQFGSDAQKERFLPAILSGDDVWCQGYSEPNAGSDLASVRTSAVEDDSGNYIVNGQKTWTTYAQYADWIFCLVRTDVTVKKQAGISFLLIDVKSPGVEVVPMLTLGGTPAFCETFFENVSVPAENLVGPKNGGWTLAKALLGHERTLIAAVGQSQRTLRRIKKIAAQTTVGGRSLLGDTGFRGRIARLQIELRGLQMQNYRALAGAQLGKAPGPESSTLKIRGAEIAQRAHELAMEVMGHNSLSWFNPEGVIPSNEQSVAPAFNYTRATTIYGGSNEIQKNVIAKYILGLPQGSRGKAS